MNADEIAVWNRAAMHSGGSSPREGDRALSAVLRVHGLVMNGGVFHALEVVSEAELRASCAGFGYFGFAEVADLLEAACDEEWTDESEGRFNGAYGKLLDDGAIVDSFVKHMARDRELYAR